MFKEKPFWYKWMSTFLVQTVTIAIAGGVLLLAGRLICYSIPWRDPGALLYQSFPMT